MRVDIWNKPQVHIPSGPQNPTSPERGRFFNEHVRLRSGDYSVRIQVMFSPSAEGEAIEIRAVDVRRGVMLASEIIIADRSTPKIADHIYLEFSYEGENEVRIFGLAERNADTTLLRHLTVLSKVANTSREKFYFPSPSPASLKNVKWLNFGTTGVCTASCIHCPTNKPDRRMPVGRMGMGLFQKIVLELKDGGFEGNIIFGLFGEPLDDPLLEKRILYIKTHLKSSISIATNCSHYDRKIHESIVAMADNISVHVESTNTEVYNRIMEPLKAARVFPRVESIIATARDLGRNNITLTTPVHRGNLASYDRVADYFGCDQTNFSSLSNRAWDEGPFQELAVAPVGVCCKPDRLRDEIFVDWDGSYLPCCIDFSKSMPLGNLQSQTFAEIFASEAWNSLSETFRKGEWSTKKACAVCRSDHPEAVSKIVQRVSPSNLNPASEYEPWRFTFEPMPSGSPPHLGEQLRYDKIYRDGIVIYGPYIHLPKGRYRLIQRLTPTNERLMGEVELDVACDSAPLAVTRRIALSELNGVAVALDFEHTGEGTLEFRVWKFGDVAFKYAGATVIPWEDLANWRKSETKIFDAAPVNADMRHFSAERFQVMGREHVEKANPETLYHDIETTHSDGIVIYGPYASLPRGRYRVLHHMRPSSPTFSKGALVIDVARLGRVLCTQRLDTRTVATNGFQIAFDHDGLGEVEFRVYKFGPVGFRYRGATILVDDPQIPALKPTPFARFKRKVRKLILFRS